MRRMGMFRTAAVLLLFVLGACSDDKKDPDPPAVDAAIDAPMQQIDAPPSGNVCTGAAYDPCTTNAQCMSNNCHLYQQQSLQVCVTTCTPGDNTTCPVDKTGARGVCNQMAICKPAVANDCTR